METSAGAGVRAGAGAIHPVTRRVLDARGLSGPALHAFLSWDLRTLPPLTAMDGVDRAAGRILEAVAAGERIAVFGDYDVDGAASCALFHHFLRSLGAEAALMQPSRFVEGYGVHPSNVEKAAADGAGLLVTVDCGTTGHEACARAAELGLDVIVTDHHADPGGGLPPAHTVVNPNAGGAPEGSPLRALAGVGVAFAVCLRVRELREERTGKRAPSLYPLLQFVALGTLCDMVPLNVVNLRLVRHGLRQLPGTGFPGLRSLLTPDERNRPSVPSDKVVFQAGPLLNAKGRTGHPEKALRLLVSEDNHEISECRSHLTACNNERKRLQGDVFREARRQVLEGTRTGGGPHVASVAHDPSWHEGVIGIVASKLVETFRVPAVVLTRAGPREGVLKASARSAGSYDILAALRECGDLFTAFGGHRGAAGFSMPEGNLREFADRLRAVVARAPEDERTERESFDVEVRAGDISVDLVRSLELLEPFGNGNPKPVLRMRDAVLHSYDVMKDVHVRWTFRAGTPRRAVYHRGVSFNYLTRWRAPRPADLLAGQGPRGLVVDFTLGTNLFRGREYIQLNVERVALGPPPAGAGTA